MENSPLKEILLCVIFPIKYRYLESLKGDMFKTCFADCHFDEIIFPPLGREKSRFMKSGIKLHGMHNHCLILTHVQIKVKELFIYKELQTIYLMHLLT